MEIRVKVQEAGTKVQTDGRELVVETCFSPTISNCFNGVGIETDVGRFGVAQRDGGLEVLLDGDMVFARYAHSPKPVYECTEDGCETEVPFLQQACAEHLPAQLRLDREQLRLGKYTKGYDKLTSEQLHGLLWLLGEWAVRAGDEDDDARDHRRCKAARAALKEFHRKPFTLDEAQALMRRALRGPR